MDILHILSHRLTRRPQRTHGTPAAAPASPPFDQLGHAATMARIEANIATYWDDERLEAERRIRSEAPTGGAGDGPVRRDTIRVIENMQRRRAAPEGSKPPLLFLAS